MRVPAATSQTGSRASNEARPSPPPPRRRFLELAVEAGSAPPHPVPMGGPLALHRAPERAVDAPAPAELVSRMIVGATREGLAEVRLDVAVGALRGTEVRLLAGPAGLEATFLAATESARRIVEAQLGELARALESRGLQLARCEVSTRERPRPMGDRRSRPSWEDGAE